MRRCKPEAVCRQPDLLEPHAVKDGMMISCRAHAPVHVHICHAQYTHPLRLNQTNTQSQVRSSGVRLVQSNGRETPRHGGLRAQESMGFAMSCKTENREQKWRCAAFGVLGGRKNNRNFPYSHAAHCPPAYHPNHSSGWSAGAHYSTTAGSDGCCCTMVRYMAQGRLNPVLTASPLLSCL